MRFKRITFLVVFVFTLAGLLSLSQLSLASEEGPDVGAVEEESFGDCTCEGDAVDEDAYERERGPAWARGEHPGLRGLRVAYGQVSQNPATVRAQAVLQALIEARTVTESIYLLEEATDEEGALEQGGGDEAVREALGAEIKRIKAEARRQFRERNQLAWALKKLGRALHKLGERIEAEQALVEAAGIVPQDQSVYQALSDLYAGTKGAQVPVFIKGKKMKFDVPPRIVSGRMLVPLRKFAETLGCTVDWHPEERQVVFVQGNRVVVLGVGENTATVDGEQVSLDVAAVIVNGRMLVPIRFISETLDAQVDYYAQSSMVVVS
ncbi:MAG TPA: copper amine oxidase N-terminal domain-containing protein [Desulfotomaculum sp.]|nr:copper amine oxidase N-terminal domain-containing protein [Desulfotomaculum sp.]